MAMALTRGELNSALRATAKACKRPLGDPARLADLVSSPDDAVTIAMSRVNERRTPRAVATFAWPKVNGQCRTMTYLDPFDEVIYRGLVGRFVRQIEGRMDRAHALAAVPATSAPFWRLSGHGAAIGRRTDMALEWLDGRRVSAMGTIDVRQYFYEITPDVLRFALAGLGGPDHTKLYLARWLDRVAASSGCPGLPVGHEPSSVLGNFVLQPVDEFLQQHLQKWLRYMDDIWVFTSSAAMAEAARDAVAQELQGLRLEINETKWAVYGDGDARDVVRSATNDYVDPVLRDPNLGAGEARSLFSASLEDPERTAREMRRSLTVLGRHRDLFAVEHLQSTPGLVQFAPEHWSAYVAQLASDKATRRQLDMDWFEESITSPRSGFDDAERLILMPALEQRQATKATGARLLDLATSEERSIRVRVGAAAAWGRAQGWKRDRAADAAIAAPSFAVRRALALTLEQLKDDAKMPAIVEKLRAVDPDLEPTLSLIAA